MSEADLQRAWNQVVDAFPFPEYLKIPRGHLDVARTVLRLLPAGSRVLDFGGGPADKTGVLAALGFQCTVIDDLQDPWHAAARDKILQYASDMGIDYLPTEGDQLPDTVGEFDMLMSHDVLEHMPSSPRYLLSDLVRRVRTGGYLYVTVPNFVNIRKRIAVLFGRTNLPPFELYYWAPIPFRGHIREFTRDDCIKLADSLGLELVEVTGWHQGLDRVPRGLLWPYLFASTFMPNTRDSWRMIARKPPGWAPKVELDDAEMLARTGLTNWRNLGH